MTRVVNIGNNEVTLKSTATTAFRYKQVFGTDLKKDMIKLDSSLKKEDNKDTGIDALYMIMQLAYIMFCQAADKIKTASEDDYYNWLEGFEEEDFMNENTINSILTAWNKSLETTSKLKNQQGPQIET